MRWRPIPGFSTGRDDRGEDLGGGGNLIEVDPFVGCVSLGNRAGAEHDAGHTCGGEDAGVGAIAGGRAVRGRAATPGGSGKLLNPRRGLRVGRGVGEAGTFEKGLVVLDPRVA